MYVFDRLIGRRYLNRVLLGLAPIAWAFGSGAASASDGRLTVKSPMPNTPSHTPRMTSPLDAMSIFLNGFHFYADDMGRQVEANHFCTHLAEDFHQCAIYDSDKPDAKLIGIEYIVSERVFRNLPDDEKRLWHSHHYEVKSGELIAPGIPEAAEHKIMMDLVTTYGKTWHCWQIDRDPAFPFGIPQLMMGFTHDGQANRQMVLDRDRRFDVSSSKREADRTDVPMPTVQAGANSWQSGRTVQLKLEEVAVRNLKT
jgi:hypothetical protein